MRDESTFPCYPNYKDSGINWLPRIPAHWIATPLKRIATLKSGEMITADSIETTGNYAVYGGNGLRGYASAYTHEGTYAMIGRQGALCGNVNYSQGKFWASEHAVVAMPVKPLSVHWFGELLRTMNLNQYSVAAAQPGLSVEAVSNLLIPYPSLSEQELIGAFLDRETTKIDALIGKQERLIALLTEKRQAVISHAVTKGLDPNVPMKEIGVEWIGHVPAHWLVMPLSRITADKCDGPFGSGLKSEHYSATGIRVIRLQNIRSDGFDDRDSAYVAPDYYAELQGHDVISGDVLIAGLGDERNFVGRACVAPAGIAPAMVKADCFRFRLEKKQANSAYIATLLTATAGAAAGLLATGSTRSRIPLSTMASRLVLVPPLDEQLEVVDEIRMQTERFVRLAAKASQSIDLLKERRAALISAAVTGKIDVRQAA